MIIFARSATNINNRAANTHPLMRAVQFDYYKWRILLTVIQLSGNHCSRLEGYFSIRFFGLSIQSKSITNMWLSIQIQFSKWIDNPIQSQSNYLSKDMGQQVLNGQVLWWNHDIPKRNLSSTYNFTDKLIVWKFWLKLAWLHCWSMMHYEILFPW